MSVSVNLKNACYRWMWLLVVIFVLTAGCTSTPAKDLATPVVDPLADQSFLTQQPCASPCWYGLEPDKSGVDQVYATLKELPFIDSSTIDERETSWFGGDTARQIGFSCSHPKDENCGGDAVISKGILKRLVLSPPPGLTFQKAVEVLSEPSHIDYYPWHPEVGGCVISLIWFPKEISVTSIDRESEEQCQKIQHGGRVAPNILVDSIMYVSREASTSQPAGCINCYPWFGFVQP